MQNGISKGAVVLKIILYSLLVMRQFHDTNSHASIVHFPEDKIQDNSLCRRGSLFGWRSLFDISRPS